jgi:YbgC/YbaW family acyl-CoA thioester hydrolase
MAKQERRPKYSTDMPHPRPVGKDAGGFSYTRRVNFVETDMAGIVHFSAYFRYMEEAEHALWRAAGLTIGDIEKTGGWPRVSATFDYKSPLRFDDEFQITVRVGAVTRRSFRYDFMFTRGDVLIGTGSITAVSSTKEDGRLRAVDVPQEFIARLRAAAGHVGGS